VESYSKFLAFSIWQSSYASQKLLQKGSFPLTLHLHASTGPNILIYLRDKLISDNTLFGKYIDMIFPLKQKDIKNAKLLLNNL
jgi:hypothetical protein